MKEQNGSTFTRKIDENDIHTKKYNPNFLSRLFICWMCPVFYRGNKRDLEEEDLISPSSKYNSEVIGEKLERYWQKELDEATRKGRTPSLWKAVRNAYWLSYMPGGLLIFGAVTCRTIQPILFTQLLRYWSTTEGNDMTRLEAGYYGLGMIGLIFLAILLQHHNALFSARFGMKIRVACCSLLYRKVLRMSQTSLGEIAAGRLVNLMSNDVARFDYVFMFLHYLWIVPIQTAVVLYLMYITAQNAAPLIGLIVVIIFIMPLQAILTKFTAVIRRRTAIRTDKRIKIMSEIINGIQVIKMYAWEKPFQKVVHAARQYEMITLRQSLFIRSTFLGFMLFTERSSMLVTILALILMGNMITATVVYPIQQYFSILQFNMAMILPLAIAFLSEMMVSLERIKEYLLKEERHDISRMPVVIAGNDITFKSKKNGEKSPIETKKYITNGDLVEKKSALSPTNSDIAVEMTNVSAGWTTKDQGVKMTLKDLTLRMKKGKLCAIIGPVGSGKSSLLQLLLKELPLREGEMTVNGTLSYACQESWLFPATVRENILFGLDYDSVKYKEVCRVCSLYPDFKQFPYGDQSLVGERGVSLSGGQRARINLARAIYREADIYLLDDPLSAVDSNVGRQLFEGCINGYLRNRTRILVTHQIHFLKDADYIIILNEGGIDDIGTYSELSKSGKDFSKLLSSLQEGTDDDEKSEKDKSRPSLSRGTSTISKSEEVEEETKGQVMEAEERAKGKLKWKIVWEYFTSVESWCIVFWAFAVLAITQIAASAADFWISFWTNQVDIYKQGLQGEKPDSSMHAQIGPLTTAQYLLIHGCLILIIIIFAHVRIYAFVVMTMRASQRLHDKMFNNLIKAIMRFFDTSSSGRILNRFSKDTGAMDEFLPRSTLETIQMYLQMISVLILNAIALPWTLIPTAILMGIFVVLLRLYLNAAQAVKRLEGTTKSPVFGMLNSTLSGMSTIRSSDSQNRLIRVFDECQNLHSSAWHTYVGGSNAFGLFLDIICLVYLAFVIGIFIIVDFGTIIPVGNVGLAVTQSMALTMLLQMAARFTADFIGQMTAVERVLEYTKLTTEENLSDGPVKPNESWPQSGAITFRNVYLKYGKDDPLVLKGLNVDIKDKWKVGVVGRTGAGKSSMISALFRLANIEGTISLDGLDTKQLAKQELRSKISIIPQEPVLFSATMRYNLDPFNTYSDDEIWRALEQVELKDIVPALDYEVAEGGSNFSVGQRQLVCLARAVLRSNRILVMDEATANVDPQTDALIQKTIRRQFADCTVITIAHRLNTIMDSDRVLVMDKGLVAEFDHPYILLQNSESHLSFMAKETGEKMKNILFEMAKTKYFQDNPNES